MGAISDRTRTRLGRRAPFFLLAMPISALILVLTGNLPEDPTFLLVAVAGVFLFSFIFNIGIDPYVALLADVTPSVQRGTVNGIAALFGFIGQVILLIGAAFLFETHKELVFYLVAVGLVIGFGIVALGVQEKKGSEYTDPEVVTKQKLDLRQYVKDLWHQDPEAVKLLGVKFIYQLGINAAIPFLTLFVVAEIGKAGWSDVLAPVGLGTSGLSTMDAAGVSQLMGVVLLLSTALFASAGGRAGRPFRQETHLWTRTVCDGKLCLSGSVRPFDPGTDAVSVVHRVR